MARKRVRDFSRDLRIFSGSSHPELAKQIAQHLGCELCSREFRRFSNDNLYIKLGESVRGKEVVIIQSLVPPVSDNLLELLMMLDAARSTSAKRIHAVVPYYSYARSDKKDEPHISITGRLVADLLDTAGASHFMTMTLHSPQVHGFFRMPTDHLTARPAFIKHFKSRDLSNTIVVSPDIGHAKRATKLARALGVGVAAADKERLSDETVRISAIIGEVTGKDVIIFDDEVATGGSVVELIKLLLKKQVKDITVACTHGAFSDSALDRLGNMPEITEIVTTNTVPIPEEKRLDNMTILSVGAIFGEAIRCNVMGRSVGQLFAYAQDPAKGGCTS